MMQKRGSQASVFPADKKKEAEMEADKENEHSEHSEQENYERDLDRLAREELNRLQRSYRLMENDRKSFAIMSGTARNRQDRILHCLRLEKADLLLDLSNATSLPFVEQDKKLQKRVFELLSHYNAYLEDISYHLGQISEIEEQLDKITKRVIQQQLKVQALFGASLSPGMVEKRMRILGKRLYTYTSRFDSVVAVNRKIRDDIDNLLLNRGRFHFRYKKLKEAIEKSKRQMQEIVDMATSTYDQRDEAVFKIKSIRERNEKESKQHVLEMKEFQRILHHDEKSHKFMSIKNQDRQVIEHEIDRINRLDGAKNKALDDLLRNYRKSFKLLLKVAKTNDVESLLHSYNDQGLKNFSRFKNINDLNQETEALHDAINVIKGEIDQTVKESKESNREVQTEIVRKRRAFKEAKLKFTNLLASWDNAQVNMERIVNYVEAVFNLAKCDSSPIIQLLGNNYGIQPRNVILCLKILEHKVVSLQQTKAIYELRKSVEREGGPLGLKPATWKGTAIKNKPQGGPFKPKLIIAGRLAEIGQEDDDDDTDHPQVVVDLVPYSYKDLREIIMKKIRDSGWLELTDTDTFGTTVLNSPKSTESVDVVDVEAKKSRIKKQQLSKALNEEKERKAKEEAELLEQAAAIKSLELKEEESEGEEMKRLEKDARLLDDYETEEDEEDEKPKPPPVPPLKAIETDSGEADEDEERPETNDEATATVETDFEDATEYGDMEE